MSTKGAEDNFFKSWLFRSVLAPLFLMFFAPCMAIAWYQIAIFYQGSVQDYALNLPGSFSNNIPSPTWAAAKGLLIFFLFEWILLVVVPGPGYLATFTPKGNRPWYKLNGVAVYIISHVVYLFGSYGLGLFKASWVYDNLGPMLITLWFSAFVFCVFLYFKGIFFPSTNDSGPTGEGFVWDFWWGTELHPTLFGYNVKQYINCRISMIGWSLMAVSYCCTMCDRGTMSNGILVSTTLLWIYLLKFFIWESGYFGSMDIQHDRFGFYICWGVLVWVPALYPYATLYMVDHPENDYNAFTAIVIFLVGLGAIYANWEADHQRQTVRDSGGKCKVWGKEPKVIHAKYITEDGKQHQSVLLYSGWWGMSRHFHYITEILSCVCWCSGVGLKHLIGWSYVIFLTILLLDRAYRDEIRCSKKYKEYWQQYIKEVPYRVIPYIY
eukprot:TRINITY_DN2154_c0_g1_i1.p1 TRINITY_DN2154_c0_g1~~TRINITY_DN2154_c0_g1_i1.p1  ORF type:complete len:437 (-),score=84.22 TRINITY_DN2154_c0_g1_i1:52-1362(-)